MEASAPGVRPRPRRPGLRERLLWPAASESSFPISEDKAMMARTYAYLFFAGATLTLLTLLLPGAADRDALGIVVLSAVAYATCAAFLVGFDRLPLWVLQSSPILGALVVTGVLWAGGPLEIGAYAMFYFWVALAACYFFGLRVALFHIAFCTMCLAVAVLVHGSDMPLPGLYFAMGAGTLLVFGALMVLLRSQIERVVSRLTDAAGTDVLTGISNRREFEERFGHELERSVRSGGPMGLVVIDLDWFKEVNDRFGHAAGDRALKMVAGVLEEQTRRIDMVARLGGEEFAVVAPDAGEEETYRLAERLRREVKLAFADHTRPLTTSCGVATFPASGDTASDLLRAADRALYAAKDLGRDRTIVYRRGEDEISMAVARRARAGRASPRLASLVSMAESVDRRKGTPGHSRAVERFSESIARSMGLSDAHVEEISLAGLLHDIGTIGLSEAVLSKTGELTDEEWAEIRRHPEVGARILSTADLDAVSDWVYAHHERVDGTGYPRGLRDGQIPVEAQIVAVADAYAAMTADRSYRSGVDTEEAIEELRRSVGTQFLPEVVEAFATHADKRGGEAYEASRTSG
jgi:diguanylate cyclase (GGDEF)-like protein/putative nucleotidyltransferase with HDIG domain